MSYIPKPPPPPTEEPPEFTPAWFDWSAAAWLLNKRKHGTAYTYRCNYKHSNSRRCNRDVYKDQPFCRQHYALQQGRLKRGAVRAKSQPLE